MISLSFFVEKTEKKVKKCGKTPNVIYIRDKKMERKA